jgi:hypothetical protein
MKTFKIVFFSLLISSISASAQMGNNMNNRVLNQNNTVPNPSPAQPTAADIEKNRNERNSMASCSFHEKLLRGRKLGGELIRD